MSDPMAVSTEKFTMGTCPVGEGFWVRADHGRFRLSATFDGLSPEVDSTFELQDSPTPRPGFCWWVRVR